MIVTDLNDKKPVTYPEVKEFETVRLDVDKIVNERESEALTVVAYHRGGVTSARLHEKEPLVIGRAPPCNFVIPDESLSRRHARLRVVERQLYLEDLGSMNGTRIGDREVGARETPLALTDRVMLGSVELRISTQGGAAAAAQHVEGYDLFRQHLDDEVVRARHFGRCAALLVVRAEGSERAGAIIPRVTAQLSPVDRAALFSRDTVFVLLPEVDEQRLTTVINGAREEGRAAAAHRRRCRVAHGCGDRRRIDRRGARGVGPHVVEQHVAARISGPRQLAPARGGARAPLWQSPAMQEVSATIARVQRSHIPLLIARRDRHRQGGRRARAPRRRRRAPPSRVVVRQLRRHPRRRSSRASCSATRRARSPAPTSAASASSRRPRAARSSSTRSASCRSTRSRSSCACSRPRR